MIAEQMDAGCSSALAKPWGRNWSFLELSKIYFTREILFGSISIGLLLSIIGLMIKAYVLWFPLFIS
jgi:hypothetical protein